MPTDLYQRFTELLGKRENDSLFTGLLTEFGSGHVALDVAPARMHQFPTLGITIVFNTLSNCFSDVLFSVQSLSILAGQITAYAGTFLSDVCASNVRAEVQEKLFGVPMRSESSREVESLVDCDVDIYELEKLEVKFNFDYRTHEMISASVKLLSAENIDDVINSSRRIISLRAVPARRPVRQARSVTRHRKS
jgi:hypothetical protein